MQIIEYTEDILEDLSKFEMGFQNGFIISDFDPMTAKYEEELMPEMIDPQSLTSRFLSLIAYDNPNQAEEYIRIHQVNDLFSEQRIVYVIWSRIITPKLEKENPTPHELILNQLTSEPVENVAVFKLNNVHDAMNFCTEKLIELNYNFNEKEHIWEKN